MCGFGFFVDGFCFADAVIRFGINRVRWLALINYVDKTMTG